MKAVRIHDYGDRSRLRHEDAPGPQLRPGDVLIRAAAAAVNPADCQFRRGDYQAFAPLTFPAILGWDVAGTVERIGPQAAGWSVGDRVMAMCDMSRPGAYAELVAVDANHLAPAPASLPLRHAAAIPLAALTAWHALHDLAGLRARQTVLVHAAAGGVGQMAVQMARSAGARVIATASPANHALLHSLGADECIDYRASDWPEKLTGACDCVLDGAGGETRARSWSVLKPGGVMVAIAMPPIDPGEAAAHGCRAALAQVVPNGERLHAIGQLVDAGQLRVAIDSEFPLAEVVAAHARSESRHAVGKILLTMAH